MEYLKITLKKGIYIILKINKLIQYNHSLIYRLFHYDIVLNVGYHVGHWYMIQQTTLVNNKRPYN